MPTTTTTTTTATSTTAAATTPTTHGLRQLTTSCNLGLGSVPTPVWPSQAPACTDPGHGIGQARI
eukprot:6948733-Pyramimonas_sp.AAC.1